MLFVLVNRNKYAWIVYPYKSIFSMFIQYMTNEPAFGSVWTTLWLCIGTSTKSTKKCPFLKTKTKQQQQDT